MSAKKTKLFEKVGKHIIMDRREPTMGKCEMCGKEQDLRPYGPNNENICFECAMKDEVMTARKFKEMIEGQS